ncbi:MAG: hypothetical protein NC131_21090 [Roseburia sp.]|nr:hypothetical protein [Roseburia sp.]
MTHDALINGKVVQLTDEEKRGAEKFHLERAKFAWINGELVFGDEPGDDRDHQHWLLEDYEIKSEEFETINRGYMLPCRIQLFKGSDFRKIDMKEISVEDLNTLIEYQFMKYGSASAVVYNGVKVKEVGSVWPPIDTVFTLMVKSSLFDLRFKDEFKFKEMILAKTKKRYVTAVPVKEGNIVSSQ